MAHITPETELFKGRTIVVTGGASGLGQCTAYVLAYQGANLALGDLNEVSGQETVKLIQKAFPETRVSFHKCDVTDEASVDTFMEETIKVHKTIEGLAHCAGIFSKTCNVLDMSVAHFERELKVNAVGTFIMDKAVIRQIAKQQEAGQQVPVGLYSIVNIGSKASTGGNANATAYVASKHAVLGIGRCLAREWGPKHIRINTVCPGPIDTALMRSGPGIPLDASKAVVREKMSALLSAITLNTLGEPEDVAYLISHMLGPRGQFMTYAAVAVDGGWI